MSQCISSSSIQLTSTAVATSQGPNTGAIAGGIVGALVLAGVAAGVLFWYIKKKKQATEEMDVWLSNAAKTGESEEKLSPRSGHDSVVPLSYRLTVVWHQFLARFDRDNNDSCFQCHSDRIQSLASTEHYDVRRFRIHATAHASRFNVFLAVSSSSTYTILLCR
jgi:hypothetical protein